MATLADRVVDTTLAAYTALPRHGKPVVRSNGVNEWTILASISLTLPDNDTKVDESATPSSNPTSPVRILPISLGTGVKVLPATRLPPLGDTLHDSHAEILARRGFVRWLLAEAERVVRGDGSGVLVWSPEQGFMLGDGVEVWLYVSALPCGDASTLHTASHQPANVAATFRAAPELTLPGDGAVRGRHGYETYGAIRTKPGRSDSPPSISFSCSDKIASWSVLGLQGALLAPLFAPVYLDHIVVGGVEEPADYKSDEQWDDLVKAEVDRALWQRLEGIESSLTQPFRLSRPRVHLTSTEFQLSKSAVAARHPGTEPEPSPVSLSFVSVPGWKPEALVNGCTQGSAWKSPGTVLLKRGRSRLCKVEVLRAYLALREAMAGYTGWERDGQAEEPLRSVGAEVGSTVISEDATCYALKHAASAYQDTKALLRGSPGAPTSASWAARLPHEFLATGGTDSALGNAGHPPFEGWIVSGERFESFTAAGALVPIADGSVEKQG